MLKRRGMILVVLSLVMGGVAAYAANSWVQERLAPRDSDADTELVVAAATAISQGTIVEPRHLRVIRLPEGTAPEGHFRDPEALEGKVAITSVSRGEILLSERFSDHAGGSTLAAMLDPNKRAVTVRVDDVVGVAGFLLPGNRVDVLATKSDRRSNETRVETILRHIRVLAVDQTASTERNEPIIVRAVTLELTPAQSEQLVKAREEGRIQLSLRNPNELVEPEPEPEAEPEEEKEEVAEAPPPAAAPAPRPRRATNLTVQIIRGTKTNTERTRN